MGSVRGAVRASEVCGVRVGSVVGSCGVVWMAMVGWVGVGEECGDIGGTGVGTCMGNFTGVGGVVEGVRCGSHRESWSTCAWSS